MQPRIVSPIAVSRYIKRFWYARDRRCERYDESPHPLQGLDHRHTHSAPLYTGHYARASTVRSVIAPSTEPRLGGCPSDVRACIPSVAFYVFGVLCYSMYRMRQQDCDSMGRPPQDAPCLPGQESSRARLTCRNDNQAAGAAHLHANRQSQHGLHPKSAGNIHIAHSYDLSSPHEEDRVRSQPSKKDVTHLDV